MATPRCIRLLLILLMLAALPAGAQSRDELLRTARVYKDKKLYPDAMVMLDQLIEKYPADKDALTERAYLNDETGERAAAIRDWMRLRGLYPADDTVMLNLGNLFEHSGMLDSALACYNICLRRANTRAKRYAASIDIGSVYNYQQAFAKAIKHYEQMRRDYPDSLGMLTNLAQSYADGGQKDKAAAMMEEIVRRNERFAGAYNNLGMLYSETGNYAASQKAFERGLTIADTTDVSYYAMLHNNYGYLLYRMKSDSAALRHINRSIEGYPTNPYAFRNRALVYLDMKRMKEACEDLAESSRLGFKIYYGNEVEELQAKHCR